MTLTHKLKLGPTASRVPLHSLRQKEVCMFSHMIIVDKPVKGVDHSSVADKIEEEAEEDVAAPSPKGKGLFPIPIPRALKRKTTDRSPEASTSIKKSDSHDVMVCVQVPAPPIPHELYQQLGASASMQK